MNWLRLRIASFGYALRGVARLVAGEPNAQIHTLATGLVVLLAFLLEISASGWALLVLAMGLVWAAEALNTAIERLSDRFSAERDPEVGRAKDAAAGGVLLAALAAATVGVLVLGPPLWSWLAR